MGKNKIKLDNKNSLIYIHHTKIFKKEITQNFEIELAKIPTLINKYFKTNFSDTIQFMKENNLLDKNYKFEQTYNQEDYNEFLKIFNQNWVMSEKGLYVTKTGLVKTKIAKLKTINYYGKIEGTVWEDGETVSVPKLIYSTFNTDNITYNDIISIGFKDNDNTNNSFDNLICNGFNNIEIELDIDEFYNSELNHKLYLIIIRQLETNEILGKIGVTKYDVKTRFKSENVEIIKSFEFDFNNGIIARGFESLILERILPYNIRIKPTSNLSGKSEYFLPQYYDSILEQIKKYLIEY